MRYLTPAYFTATQTGLDLSNLSARELSTLIRRAESRVDNHCRVPGFQPLTVANESHEWNTRTRRFRFDSWPNPITSVTAISMQIGVDNNVLDATQVYVNNDEGFIEITELASMIGPTLIVTGAGLAEVLVNYSAGYTFSVISEHLVNVGDNLTYAAPRPLWDSTLTVNVYKNGTPQASGYTVNATEGLVTFSAPNAVSDAITADYTYHVPDDIRDATALIVVDMVGERGLQAAGMTGLFRARAGSQFQVERPAGKSGPELPDEARNILQPYVHDPLFGGA